MFITFLQMGLANEVQLIPLLYLLNAVDGVIYGQALTTILQWYYPRSYGSDIKIV